MASIYDVDPSELIEKLAVELKKNPNIKPPVWAAFVKTGVHKQRPPVKEDWWYTRAASILRAVKKLGAVGVSKLRTKYGGKQSRGYDSERFKKGSGSIIRKILQQLEKAELIKKEEKGIHRGRIIAPKGASLLDKVAAQISKGKPKKDEIKTEEKKEQKPATVEKKEDDKKVKEPAKPKAPKVQEAAKEEIAEKNG